MTTQITPKLNQLCCNNFRLPGKLYSSILPDADCSHSYIHPIAFYRQGYKNMGAELLNGIYKMTL